MPAAQPQRAYSAADIASWFLRQIDREAGEAITHLKLQKLVFYADAWSLALNGRELVNERFQAWAHGPVARSLYDRLNQFSWKALEVDCLSSDAEFDEDALDILQQVQGAYGPLQAKALEEMTHKEQPWITARGDLPPEARSNAFIDKELTAHFYKSLYDQINDEKHAAAQ